VAAAVLAMTAAACAGSDAGTGAADRGTVTSAPDAAAPTSADDGAPGTTEPSTVAPTAIGRCSEPATGAAQATVLLWEIIGGDEGQNAFDELVAEFNASQTAVRLVAESVGGANDLLFTLSQTPAAEWPDLVVATPQALKRLLDSGRVVRPDECPGGQVAGDGLLPVVRATYEVDGVLQAVPFGVSTSVLWFDAVEMRAAGLDPASPPATLEALAAASRQIVDSGVSPYGLVVYDWMTAYLITNGALQRGEMFALPDNGRSGGPVSVDLDTPANRETLTWLRDIVAVNGGVSIGLTPAGVEDLTRVADPLDGATMTVHTSAALGDVIALLEAGSFPGVELGVSPLPGPGRGAVLGGNGFFLIDHGDPARAGAAFDVVTWFTEPANIARFDAATGYIPPSFRVAAEPVLVAAWAEHPEMRVAWDQVLALPGNDVTAGALFGPSAEVERLFFELTADVVDNGMPPAEALQGLTDDINALLAQYDAVIGSGG
jgi:sn-glycerol 3-phosphate transport system substrate-binding protein